MNRLAIFQSVGPAELLIVLAVLLLVFGASRIPKLARSLGKSAKEFKKGLNEDSNDQEPEEENAPSDKP